MNLDRILRDIPYQARPPVDYRRYLLSGDWRILRHRKRVQTGGLCERCGNRGEHVHHLHYRTLGRENLSDLQLLCAACHRDAHALIPA